MRIHLLLSRDDTVPSGHIVHEDCLDYDNSNRLIIIVIFIIMMMIMMIVMMIMIIMIIIIPSGRNITLITRLTSTETCPTEFTRRTMSTSDTISR